MALRHLAGRKNAGVQIQGTAAREQVRSARPLHAQHGIAVAHAHDRKMLLRECLA